MMPAEIAKLIAHAWRAKKLMKATATASEKASVILDHYEEALSSFVGNLKRIKHEGANLTASLAEMGNGGDVIATAFQNDDECAQPHALKKRAAEPKLRAPFMRNGRLGAIASTRRENGVVTAIRVQIGSHLSEWLAPDSDTLNDERVC